MTFTVSNLCDRPVSIRLNTGVTRHLMPRGKIAGLRKAEFENNRMIDKLRVKRLIDISNHSTELSKHMSAEDAIAHIESAPASSLEGCTEGEERVTVLRAFENRMREIAG